jgi:hypothetical protein
MDSRVLGAVARGNGLVTTPTLRRLGVDPRQIATWVKQGRLVAVWRGVYTTRELWDSWDLYSARPLARVRAVDLGLTLPHVVSHDSAALLHGLPLIRPQDSAVHVARLHLRATVTRTGVRHHGARYSLDQVVVVDGIATLDLARTVVDIAREHGYREGLVAADGALQLGVTRRDLQRAAAAMEGWPFSRTVRAVVADADPGAESAAESLARELLAECGFTDVETQFPVAIPGGVAWCDLRVGRHIFEVHGRKKFRPIADGGLADRELEQLLWDERRRLREVCATGLGASTIVWQDYWGRARERARERLRREYAVTETRFGSELTPEQAEFAARMRGRRYRTAG